MNKGCSNDLIPIYEAFQNIFVLDSHCTALSHNVKQIIKHDYSELFRQIVEPDKPELIILASSHSTGKTSLAISLALEFARKCQKEVNYFSLELTTNQFVLRLLSIEASVDINRLKQNLLEYFNLNQMV